MVLLSSEVKMTTKLTEKIKHLKLLHWVLYSLAILLGGGIFGFLIRSLCEWLLASISSQDYSVNPYYFLNSQPGLPAGA